LWLVKLFSACFHSYLFKVKIDAGVGVVLFGGFCFQTLAWEKGTYLYQCIHVLLKQNSI